MPISSIDILGDFPSTTEAEPDGLLAFGGDTDPERLLHAYRRGIFPWYNEQHPVLWWAPPERCVMRPGEFHTPRSLRPKLNQAYFRITMDTAFADVLQGCQTIGENRRSGTWLNDELRSSLIRLHDRGFAHSVEAWRDGELVGGLYGLSLGGMFFGESMFSAIDDASKVCLYHLCDWLDKRSFDWMDCQIYNEHLGRLGAYTIPRFQFERELKNSLERVTLSGPWKMPGQAE